MKLTVPGLADTLAERRIERQRWTKDRAREWIGGGPRYADESDIGELISQSTLIRNPETDAVEVAYLRLTSDFTSLRKALDHHAKWEPHMRSRGLATISLKFGYRPPTGFRTVKCETYALAREDPKLNDELLGAADHIVPWYADLNPELFKAHSEAASKIVSAWQWNPVYTSGVANRDSQLPYHYDAGNFRDVWSGMLGLKEQIEGGYLAVPEYGIGLEIADGSLTMFDGQGALHGVTAMRRTRTTGHRYTIVYYGLQGMWQCLDPSEEAARANARRTARELRTRTEGRSEDRVGKPR